MEDKRFNITQTKIEYMELSFNERPFEK